MALLLVDRPLWREVEAGLWPTAAVPRVRRKRPLEDQARAGKDRLQVRLPTGAIGHFQSIKRRKDGFTNDRCQGAAGIAR